MERLKGPELSKSQNASRNSSKASSSTVSRGIQMLFSAYRRDDFADPEGFVTQLGVILAGFPEEVVAYVTSPRTGMQRRSKWPPTISEILTACEEHQEYLKRVRTERPRSSLASLPRPEPQPGDFARIHVPWDHRRYPDLVEWAKTANPREWLFGKSSVGVAGIWVSHGKWWGDAA